MGRADTGKATEEGAGVRGAWPSFRHGVGWRPPHHRGAPLLLPNCPTTHQGRQRHPAVSAAGGGLTHKDATSQRWAFTLATSAPRSCQGNQPPTGTPICLEGVLLLPAQLPFLKRGISI